MLEFLSANPWVPVAALGILALILSHLGHYWHKVQLARLDNGLVQEMVQRGMSADEIVRILEARAKFRKFRPRGQDSPEEAAFRGGR